MIDFGAKQESNAAVVVDDAKTSWSRLKDPRIVRVSSKDRHSKVCTVRGLRDRRVRLSVPTAIQLYDLQERLGLSQPSKVVDWLLHAAKHDIDGLPPLQGIMLHSGQGGKLKDSHQSWNGNDEQRYEVEGNNQGNSFLSSLMSRSSSWDPSSLSLS